MVYVSTEILERRRKVTSLLVRGLSPGEIAQVLNVPRETIYNDIRIIRSRKNEELVAHSRRETIIQLILNVHERTKQLWDIVHKTESQYVKLMALKELRVQDELILENVGMLGGATQPVTLPSRLAKYEMEEKRDLVVLDEDEPKLEPEKELEKKPEITLPKPTQTNQEPPCQSVNLCPNPLSDKDFILQMDLQIPEADKSSDLTRIDRIESMIILEEQDGGSYNGASGA